MTPEELGLKYDRLLDAKVALEVMGHSDLQLPTHLTSAIDGITVFVPDPRGGKCYGRRYLPTYSVGSHNFCDVIEQLGRLGFVVLVEWGIEAKVTIKKYDQIVAEVVDCWIAPAVCKAALLAVANKGN